MTLFDLWDQAIWRLERLLKGVTAEPDFVSRCDELTTLFAQLVQRDADIGIYLSMRQDPRRLRLYGLTHTLHVALVCQLMATRMAWTQEATRSLVKAALTMNLTIIDLQGRFATQGRLTDEQRDRIRVHPVEAVEQLRAGGVGDEVWLRAVAEHHEQAGGGGYPTGLDQPAEAALALRMADVFMAKISPRTARAPMPIQDAARQMYSESKGHALAAAIIKEYGIYPPGDFVQLASGELAVVIRRGATAHTPTAAAITDRHGIPVVSTTRRDTSQAAFAIVAPARDQNLAVRVPPERLFGLVK